VRRRVDPEESAGRRDADDPKEIAKVRSQGVVAAVEAAVARRRKIRRGRAAASIGLQISATGGQAERLREPWKVNPRSYQPGPEGSAQVAATRNRARWADSGS